MESPNSSQTVGTTLQHFYTISLHETSTFVILVTFFSEEKYYGSEVHLCTNIHLRLLLHSNL